MQNAECRMRIKHEEHEDTKRGVVLGVDFAMGIISEFLFDQIGES